MMNKTLEEQELERAKVASAIAFEKLEYKVFLGDLGMQREIAHHLFWIREQLAAEILFYGEEY